jgi:hypothetical protein
MANCCGGDKRCRCTVIAGPNTTVTGGGSTGNPYIISVDPPVTACGLSGDGTTASPLTANVAAWPFACAIGDSSSGVYCDPDSGELRADPRYWSDFEGEQATTSYLAAPIPVPAVQTVIETVSIDITNPDPCRRGLGLLFREVDLDFELPLNSGAMAGIDGDDMVYLGNTGNRRIFATHAQTNKITSFTLAPGETRTITMNVEAGRGSGGATITRVQKSLRAYVWSNHFN